MLLGIEKMEPGEIGSHFCHLSAVHFQMAVLPSHTLSKSRGAPATSANKIVLNDLRCVQKPTQDHAKQHCSKCCWQTTSNNQVIKNI